MWKGVLPPFTKEEILTLLLRLQGVWYTRLQIWTLGILLTQRCLLELWVP